MKTISYPMVVALGLATLCFAGSDWTRWSVREQETIQKTLTLSGSPMRLVIDNVDGYVHVTGTSGTQVRMTAHKTIRADTDGDLQEAKADVKLETTEKPGSVEIYYDAPWRCNGGSGGCHGEHRHFYNVTYDIDVQVPQDARVVISTVNDGDVRVDKTAGDFDVSNVNGGISMESTSGSGEVHTVNGSISVHFKTNPVAPSSFKSINGQLDLYFQPDFSADLVFKIFNGQIYSDFDVTPRPAPAAETEQRSGKFVYHSNRLRAGRVGHGGPEITIDTLNGTIRLHRADQGSGPNE